MSGSITRVVVFDQYLYHGKGDVYQWCRKITTRFGREARHYAPVRSGELREGISTDTSQVGVRQVQGVISSSAPHTMYVLKGTTGPIMSNKHWANPTGGTVELWKGKGKDRKRVRVRQKGHYMHLPEGNGFDSHFTMEVDGQQANNFLLKAWRGTARDHRAIRGVVSPF